MLQLQYSFSKPHKTAENLYKKSHIKPRNTIEGCFGAWKRRFPILSVRMHVLLEPLKTIVAAAVLHNLAIKENNGIQQDEIVRIEGKEEDVVVHSRHRRQKTKDSLIRKCEVCLMEISKKTIALSCQNNPT